jgi:hypothetical protein
MGDGGYLLPAEIEPENSIYVCIAVPDEPEHRQAFAGAIHELTRWWNWQKDDDKNGRLVAHVWWDIYASVIAQLNDRLDSCSEECNPVIYGIRTVGCELQVQYEDSGDWTPIGDFSECGATGPAGEDGEDGANGADGADGSPGPTGATGPAGADGEDAGGPDSEGGVPDPTPGEGVLDVRCAVASGVADKAVDLLLVWLQQRQLETLFADSLVLAGAVLLSGITGMVIAAIAGGYGVWQVSDAEAAEQELIQAWRDEAKCRLYCNLPSTGSITRAALDAWAVDMADYSANAGGKFATMLDGVSVMALRNEANLAAMVDGSCDGCECGPEVKPRQRISKGGTIRTLVSDNGNDWFTWHFDCDWAEGTDPVVWHLVLVPDFFEDPGIPDVAGHFEIGNINCIECDWYDSGGGQGLEYAANSSMQWVYGTPATAFSLRFRTVSRIEIEIDMKWINT